MPFARRKLKADERERTSDHGAKAPYVTPALERLGRWSALTLPHKVPTTMAPLLSTDRRRDDRPF